MKTKSTLDPYNPQSIELVEHMMDELLPNFSSGYFNANLDEPFELGMGRSREAVEEKGVGRVFLEYVIKVNELTKARDKKMLMWGDMPSKHPEIIPEIPEDITVLEWGYEADHPFDRKCEKLADGGLEFMVCPGTSSWTTFSGRTDNMYHNISNAVKSGLKNGAKGMLLTDWGDMGHWQYLPVSYAGFVWGAGWSWNTGGMSESLLINYLNTNIYKDRQNIMGTFSLDLGRYNRFEEILMFNMTLCNLSYQFGIRDRIMYEKIMESMESTFTDLTSGQFNTETIIERFSNKQAFQYSALLLYLKNLEDSLALADMQVPDAQLVMDEYTNAIRMIRMGAHLKNYIMIRNEMELLDRLAQLREMKLMLAKIIEEHERLWLARNRPGGLPRSEQVLVNLQQGIDNEIALLNKGPFAVRMNRLREKVMTAVATFML
jgi:hexosaminidase